jgi:hypothetical protein
MRFQKTVMPWATAAPIARPNSPARILVPGGALKLRDEIKKGCG